MIEGDDNRKIQRNMDYGPLSDYGDKLVFSISSVDNLNVLKKPDITDIIV